MITRRTMHGGSFMNEGPTMRLPPTEPTARTVTGEERSRLWNEISEKYTNYADYQKKTEREIPVVVLEPAS